MRVTMLAVVSATMLLTACGSDPKPAPVNPTPTTGTYPPPGPYPTTQPTTQPTVAPTTPPAPTTPAPTSNMATPLTSVPELTALITLYAHSQVPGMKAEGNAMAGQFQEGQVLEYPFQAEVGKCYAVVAHGTPTITDLSIEIMANVPPPLPQMVFARNTTPPGMKATLGGPTSGGCWKALLPGPVKVVVKAAKGSGMAVAQVYVK